MKKLLLSFILVIITMTATYAQNSVLVDPAVETTTTIEENDIVDFINTTALNNLSVNDVIGLESTITYITCTTAPTAVSTADFSQTINLSGIKLQLVGLNTALAGAQNIAVGAQAIVDGAQNVVNQTQGAVNTLQTAVNAAQAAVFVAQLTVNFANIFGGGATEEQLQALATATTALELATTALQIATSILEVAEAALNIAISGLNTALAAVQDIENQIAATLQLIDFGDKTFVEPGTYTFVHGGLLDSESTFTIVVEDASLSIDSVVNISDFRVFSKDGILTLPNVDNVNAISVYNISGAKVYESKEAVSSIDLTSVTDGVYVLLVQKENAVQTVKFVKN